MWSQWRGKILEYRLPLSRRLNAAQKGRQCKFCPVCFMLCEVFVPNQEREEWHTCYRVSILSLFCDFFYQICGTVLTVWYVLVFILLFKSKDIYSSLCQTNEVFLICHSDSCLIHKHDKYLVLGGGFPGFANCFSLSLWSSLEFSDDWCFLGCLVLVVFLHVFSYYAVIFLLSYQEQIHVKSTMHVIILSFFCTQIAFQTFNGWQIIGLFTIVDILFYVVKRSE